MTKFTTAAGQLIEANARFARRHLSPVEHANAREAALSQALVELAAEMGVTLQTPIRIDARGEFRIVAMPPNGRSPDTGAGPFGEAFAAVLNRHRPRTGAMPGATMLPEGGWCHLNHFEAELMVLEHFRAQEEISISAEDASRHMRDIGTRG